MSPVIIAVNNTSFCAEPTDLQYNVRVHDTVFADPSWLSDFSTNAYNPGDAFVAVQNCTMQIVNATDVRFRMYSLSALLAPAMLKFTINLWSNVSHGEVQLIMNPSFTGDVVTDSAVVSPGYQQIDLYMFGTMDSLGGFLDLKFKDIQASEVIAISRVRGYKHDMSE